MLAAPGNGGSSSAGSPSGGSSNPARPGKGVVDEAQELFRLIVAYAKQETVEPVISQLKALVKGLAGAFLLAAGTVILSIGFVRALQAEFGSTQAVHGVAVQLPGVTGSSRNFMEVHTSLLYAPYGAGQHLAGDWSWVPYMGGALVCVAVAGFCVAMIARKGTSR